MNIIYLLSIIYEMSSLNVLCVLIRENVLCLDSKYYYFLRRKGNWFNELQKLCVQVLSSQEKKDEKNLLGTSYSDKEFLKKVFNVLIHIHSTVQVYCRCNIYICVLYRCTVNLIYTCVMFRCTVDVMYTCVLYRCTVDVINTCVLFRCTVDVIYTCLLYRCTVDVVCTYVLYRCTVDVIYTWVLYRCILQMQYVHVYFTGVLQIQYVHVYCTGVQGVFRQRTDSRSYRGRISIPSWKVKWKIHI